MARCCRAVLTHRYGVAPVSPRRLSSFARRVALASTLLIGPVVLAACGTEAGADRSSVADEFPEVTATTVPPTTTTPPTTAPPTTTTEPPPPPPLAQRAGSPLGAGPNGVYVLGDSVILGAETRVPPALAGWNVTFDAAESRRIDQGTGIVQAQGGVMGRVLVVHLCTNWGGGDYGAAASRLLDSLIGVERVVWVTCTPWIPAVAAADEAIRTLPGSYPNVVVADWAAISTSPGYTYNDGLHLKPEGAVALADLIAGAVGPPPT